VNDERPGLELHDAIALPRRWTYEQTVAELPESNRPCELWDGELVMSPTPSFEHQQIVLRFARVLEDWTKPRGLGIVFIAPLDMVLSPHRVTQPDVGFVSSARSNIIQRVLQGPADLVAEVVSLGGRTRDRIEKRDLYEQHGVREYWIIDPEPRSVEVLFLETAGYRSLGRSGGLDHAASQLLPGFAVPVDTLFAQIRGGV
jgi:Uma2 family endonuclease